MDTQRRSNAEIFKENRNKVVSALNKNSNGLTRAELMKKTELNRRILRKHLERLGSIITVAKENGKNKVYLTSEYDRIKAENLKIHQAWNKIANDFFNYVKQYELIPNNADAEEFFSKNIIMMVPQKTEKGFKTVMCHYPVERVFIKQ